MSKTQTYRLYINGVPQPDYAQFTSASAKTTNEVNRQPGHWQGYEWRREDRKKTTPFDVIQVDGIRKSYPGFAAYHEHLATGGMDEYRMRSAEYLSQANQPVRRAA